MFATLCSARSSNAKLLQNLFEQRHRLMARQSSESELMLVENEIIEMHRTMTRHRVHCPKCKLKRPRRTAALFDINLLYGQYGQAQKA